MFTLNLVSERHYIHILSSHFDEVFMHPRSAAKFKILRPTIKLRPPLRWISHRPELGLLLWGFRMCVHELAALYGL